MRDIDVILSDSCSGHLIYIRKFQFQWNLRWSIFRPYYCEIWTSKWLWWVSVQDTDKILVPFFKFHQTIKCISFTDWNSNIDQITLTLILVSITTILTSVDTILASFEHVNTSNVLFSILLAMKLTLEILMPKIRSTFTILSGPL